MNPNAEAAMNSQAETVKNKQTAALTAKMKHGIEKITLEKDEAFRALALKTADPKATVVFIDATLAAEFATRRENLLKSEEEFRKAEIEAEYNASLLSILKIVNSVK